MSLFLSLWAKRAYYSYLDNFLPSIVLIEAPVLFLHYTASLNVVSSVEQSVSSYIRVMILYHCQSSTTPLITCSWWILISDSDFVGNFSFKTYLSRVLTVSWTCIIMNLNSSSHSFLRIFPKRATWWSFLEYFLIPLIMLAAHSTIRFLSPYLWFRYVYMYCSIVSRGNLLSSHFLSYFILDV